MRPIEADPWRLAARERDIREVKGPTRAVVARSPNLLGNAGIRIGEVTLITDGTVRDDVHNPHRPRVSIASRRKTAEGTRDAPIRPVRSRIRPSYLAGR